MDHRSWNILIVYRVYYKVMTLVVNPNCLLSSPKDQTLIWQANEKNSTVIIPKPIPWECLTQSNEWNFKQLLAPKPIEQPKLLSITEDGQGNIQINFEPRKENLTRSYSARSSNSFLEIRTPSRRSNVQSDDMDHRSRNILIVYRVYYKVMTSVVHPNCLLSSPKDQTLIWQANEKNSTVVIPKPIP